MKERRATVEVIAATIEEAVAKGLAELNVKQDEVEVSVLDEGNRGLFGLGTRQARIRLTIKSSGVAKKDEVEPDMDEALPSEEILPSVEEAEENSTPDLQSAELEEELELHIVHETVNELLEHMGIDAKVTISFGEKADGRQPVMVDIHGEDLGLLIGKRAETLNAMQYITTLIASKKLGRNVTLVLDVENYRERRQIQIRQLARRMAEQAIKTRRRQMLEPMTAGERRIVHIELRDNEQVRTESIGEEPYRKVTIIPIE